MTFRVAPYCILQTCSVAWLHKISTICTKGGLCMSCSCLIARNLLSGLKSCSEIFSYMHRSENRVFSRDGNGMDLADGCLKADGYEIVVSPFLFILVHFVL